MFFPQILPHVILILVETCLNPTWKLHSGTSKDEIERPLTYIQSWDWEDNSSPLQFTCSWQAYSVCDVPSVRAQLLLLAKWVSDDELSQDSRPCPNSRRLDQPQECCFHSLPLFLSDRPCVPCYISRLCLAEALGRNISTLKRRAWISSLRSIHDIMSDKPQCHFELLLISWPEQYPWSLATSSCTLYRALRLMNRCDGSIHEPYRWFYARGIKTSKPKNSTEKLWTDGE